MQAHGSGIARKIGLPGTTSATPEATIIVNKKAFLAFMVEAIWKVKMVAKNKSDAVQEVVSATFIKSGMGREHFSC